MSVWPQDVKGNDLPVAFDPLTNVKICQKCWDGKHRKCTGGGGKCKCEHHNRVKVRTSAFDKTLVATISEVYGTIDIQ